MVSIFLRFETSLESCYLFWVVDISALRTHGWRDRLPLVWPVDGFAFSDCVMFLAVPVLVHNWTDGAIDRKLLPVDAESRKLNIKVGYVSSLYERIVGETDARYKLASCGSSLLRLSEILTNVAIEFELSNVPSGTSSSRQTLVRSRMSKSKSCSSSFLESRCQTLMLGIPPD